MIDRYTRNKIYKQNSFLIWFTGLPCSGKTTLASCLEKILFEKGFKTVLLDGDVVRNRLNKDLSFSKEDRNENLRRIAEISRIFIESGIIVIASFVSPYKQQRNEISKIVGANDFFEIYINTPLEECIKRDVKGMYAKAKQGKIKNFTGITDPYEVPTNPSLKLNTINTSVKDSTDIIYDFIKKKLKNE